MKRVLSSLIPIALAVGVATAAEGAALRGAYRGQTSAADPVKFKVNKMGKVTAFHFDGVHLSCTDGDEFDSPSGVNQIGSPTGKTYKIKKRKFAIKVRDNEAGNGWDATGKLNRSGTKATGTLRVFARFGEGNEADPQGQIMCDSGELTYSVKHG